MASDCSCRSPVGARSTHGRQVDLRQRRDTCAAAALLPHRAPCRLVQSTTPSSPRRLGTLCSGGMSSGTRAPRDQGCGPVLSAVSRALRCSSHESFHGFADESPRCQSASSFPVLFIRLRQHLPFPPAKRTRVLLSQYLGDKLTDLPRLPTFCNRSNNSEFLSVSLGTSAMSRRHRLRQSKAHDW